VTGVSSSLTNGIGQGPGWCCSYCSAPLTVQAHGLYCAPEGRWFASLDGVHRLLPEERRRELRPFLELYQRVRRDQGWRAEAGLPEVPADHPHAAIWKARAGRLQRGLELVAARLGPGPWRVLEVGAGCCWAALHLLEGGHQVVAVDVNLDPDDGLLAPNHTSRMARRLERAEADMEALPLEPAGFDLVLAAGSLHYPARSSRVLVELRRVTRRGGLLLVLDSPSFRRRPDGEAMVARRMRAQARRYAVLPPRESQSSYFVLGELPGLFERSGWRLEVQGWPGPLWERASDLIQILLHGRRGPRYPTLLGTRHG